MDREASPWIEIETRKNPSSEETDGQSIRVLSKPPSEETVQNKTVISFSHCRSRKIIIKSLQFLTLYILRLKIFNC